MQLLEVQVRFFSLVCFDFFGLDERSFKQEVFVATASILRNRISGVSEQEVLSFEGFVSVVCFGCCFEFPPCQRLFFAWRTLQRRWLRTNLGKMTKFPMNFKVFFFCLAKRVFPFNLFVLPDPIMSTLMRDPVTWEGEVIYCLCLGFKLLFDQVRM